MNVHGNPFSSKYIRPGANEYLFEESESIQEALARFERLDRRAQIIGPHGTGKSTLLCKILNHFEVANANILSVKLNSSKTRLSFSIRDLLRMQQETTIIIDGFEQLPAWKRFAIRKIASARRLGLLITTHEDQGMATLVSTASSPQMLRAIIRRLDRDQRLGPIDEISERELCQLLDSCHGNVREVLFRLYDRVQAMDALPMVAE